MSVEGEFERVGHRYLRLSHFLNLNVVKLVEAEGEGGGGDDKDSGKKREIIAVQITLGAGDEIEDIVIPFEDAGELCKQLVFQVAPHGPPFAKQLAEFARQHWPKRGRDAA